MVAGLQRRVLEYLAALTRPAYGRDIAKGAPLPWWIPAFVVLERLEDYGLIEGDEESLWPHASLYEPVRRVYRITDAGRAALLPAVRVCA